MLAPPRHGVCAVSIRFSGVPEWRSRTVLAHVHVDQPLESLFEKLPVGACVRRPDGSRSLIMADLRFRTRRGTVVNQMLPSTHRPLSFYGEPDCAVKGIVLVLRPRGDACLRPGAADGLQSGTCSKYSAMPYDCVGNVMRFIWGDDAVGEGSLQAVCEAVSSSWTRDFPGERQRALSMLSVTRVCSAWREVIGDLWMADVHDVLRTASAPMLRRRLKEHADMCADKATRRPIENTWLLSAIHRSGSLSSAVELSLYLPLVWALLSIAAGMSDGWTCYLLFKLPAALLYGFNFVAGPVSIVCCSAIGVAEVVRAGRHVSVPATRVALYSSKALVPWTASPYTMLVPLAGYCVDLVLGARLDILQTRAEVAQPRCRHCRNSEHLLWAVVLRRSGFAAAAFILVMVQLRCLAFLLPAAAVLLLVIAAVLVTGVGQNQLQHHAHKWVPRVGALVQSHCEYVHIAGWRPAKLLI